MGLTTKNKPAKNQEHTMVNLLKKYVNREYVSKLFFDPNYLSATCWSLLIFEIVLNLFIIRRVNYTEIDWIAYMQEVEGFLNGTLDYQHLKGDTGPLVYPAGFVYVYTIFYYITSRGENILLAQYIFLGIYLLQLYFTFEIFKKTCKIPPYALALSVLTSYRIHSIYVLRLFNDPIAVLLFYISLNTFLRNKWYLGSMFFSLAVSVKMNILLYAPCLLIVYLTNLTFTQTVTNLFICGLIQLIVGAPFLYGNAISYLKGSFDLGRIFEHKWTVNYRFLDLSVFENRFFHLGLLALHILLLLIFLPAVKRYLSSYSKLNSVITDLKTQHKKQHGRKNVSKPSKSKQDDGGKLTKEQENYAASFERMLKQSSNATRQRNVPNKNKDKNENNKKDTMEINFSKVTQLFVLPFFVTNLIGIACARSLHYQFYCWYFHSLIYLIHCTTFRKSVMFLILGVIEFCWNVYPSTYVSSALLHGSHILLLYGVYKYMRQ